MGENDSIFSMFLGICFPVFILFFALLFSLLVSSVHDFAFARLKGYDSYEEYQLSIEEETTETTESSEDGSSFITGYMMGRMFNSFY